MLVVKIAFTANMVVNMVVDMVVDKEIIINIKMNFIIAFNINFIANIKDSLMAIAFKLKVVAFIFINACS